MTDRKQSFEVTGAVHLDITTQAGDIILSESSDNTVTVTLSGSSETVAETTIEQNSDSIIVRTRSPKRRWFSKAMDVHVAAPAESTVRVGLAAGDVVSRMNLKAIDVSLAAGDVVIQGTVSDVRAKVGSGDVKILEPVDDLFVSSANGDVHAGSVDEARITTASGNLDIGMIKSAARCKTASGEVKIHRFDGSDLDIKSMSGNATVGLPPGLEVDARISTISGELHNRLKPSNADDRRRVTLTVKSFSGDVTLRSPW
ncbi:MAG: DUF4097 family beta strand repeat-containing protein [Actinomycetota bacterium]